MDAVDGIVKNIDTFNPIRIAFHEWAAIARDLAAVRSVREGMGMMFGPPGWLADGFGLTSKRIRETTHAAAGTGEVNETGTQIDRSIRE